MGNLAILFIASLAVFIASAEGRNKGKQIEYDSQHTTAQESQRSPRESSQEPSVDDDEKRAIALRFWKPKRPEDIHTEKYYADEQRVARNRAQRLIYAQRNQQEEELRRQKHEARMRRLEDQTRQKEEEKRLRKLRKKLGGVPMRTAASYPTYSPSGVYPLPNPLGTHPAVSRFPFDPAILSSSASHPSHGDMVRPEPPPHGMVPAHPEPPPLMHQGEEIPFKRVGRGNTMVFDVDKFNPSKT